MKLHEFKQDELEKLEKDLAFDSRRMIDKHKRWEVEQKLKLVRAEIERRKNPFDNLFREVKRWFGN